MVFPYGYVNKNAPEKEFSDAAQVVSKNRKPHLTYDLYRRRLP